MLVAGAGLCTLAAEVEPSWPGGAPAQLRDDVFGLRLRVTRELKGDKAAEQFLRDAFAKHPEGGAKAYMAWACLFGSGWGMPSLQDPVRGKLLALEAAADESMVAADVLGRAIGLGVVKDMSQSDGLVYVQKAARADEPRSVARLGLYQVIGHGVPKDLARGIALMKHAAEIGFASDLVEVGDALENGRMGLAVDLATALNLYYEAALHREGAGWQRLEKLAATKPEAQKLLLLVQVHEANNLVWTMPSKARNRVRELEKVAGDDPRALVEVGDAYLVGYYAKRDYGKARSLFEKAATLDSEDARFFLAKMKLRGFGLPMDSQPAIAEIQQLADHGNYRAAAYLGWAHYWGVSEAPGVAKDAAAAFRYVRQAAARGDVWSLVNLATCYESGIGTPENYALAAKVYWQAYLRGYQPGLDKTRRLLNFVKE